VPTRGGVAPARCRHEVAEPTLNTATLERCVDDLDVEDAYDRLRDA
jgi:hypothetical protein